MILKDYMKKNRWNSATLSKEMGVTAATILNIQKGIRTPSLPLALKLFRFTDGEVSLIELLNERDLKKLQ